MLFLYSFELFNFYTERVIRGYVEKLNIFTKIFVNVLVQRGEGEKK